MISLRPHDLVRIKRVDSVYTLVAGVIRGALSFRNQSTQFDPLVDRKPLEHQQLLLRIVRAFILSRIGVYAGAKLCEQQLNGASVTKHPC